jgi:hypothetical protein
MVRTLFFRKNGTIHKMKADGFSNDPAKDLGGYSHAELRKIAGINFGAVLVRVK